MPKISRYMLLSKTVDISIHIRSVLRNRLENNTDDNRPHLQYFRAKSKVTCSVFIYSNKNKLHLPKDSHQAVYTSHEIFKRQYSPLTDDIPPLSS